MKFIYDSGTYFLDEQGKRVQLTKSDINLFRRMTPMGRRLMLRKKALDIMQAKPEDPDAKLMLSLAQLPAIEWSFIVPD